MNVYVEIEYNEMHFIIFFQIWLKKHYDQVHAEKKNKCDYCDKKFDFKSMLELHIEKKHAQSLGLEKRYFCDICDKCYVFQYSVTKCRYNHKKQKRVTGCPKTRFVEGKTYNLDPNHLLHWMIDLLQDINREYSFSRCLNRTYY